MDTARLFMSGRSQAVRLPKEYRFEGVEVVVRGISGNLMVAAAPAIVSGSAGVLRGIANTAGVQGRARIGALTTGEAIGRGAVQAPAAVRSAAATASAQVVRMAERAKRLGG